MTTKVVLIAIGLMVAGALLPEALGSTGIGAMLVSSGPFGTSGDFASYRNIFLLGIGLGVAFLFLSWLFKAGGIKIGSRG